ncbi:hypothetical protein [Streptomyces sp. NPDC002588]|uniref:hypothetical protein n=1 Tax=Streptomyces sp. NPDC002588 TaxID=3154419 RepID=UPI003318ACF7
MSKAAGDGHDLWPDRCLEILRVGVVGCLGRRGVECDTELSHQADLFGSAKTDAEVPLWLVGVAEVVEECVEDMVQVFERRQAKPHVPLPRWIGQGQYNGYDVDSVVRNESGVVTAVDGGVGAPGAPLQEFDQRGAGSFGCLESTAVTGRS